MDSLEIGREAFSQQHTVRVEATNFFSVLEPYKLVEEPQYQRALDMFLGDEKDLQMIVEPVAFFSLALRSVWENPVSPVAISQLVNSIEALNENQALKRTLPRFKIQAQRGEERQTLQMIEIRHMCFVNMCCAVQGEPGNPRLRGERLRGLCSEYLGGFNAGNAQSKQCYQEARALLCLAELQLKELEAVSEIHRLFSQERQRVSGQLEEMENADAVGNGAAAGDDTIDASETSEMLSRVDLPSSLPYETLAQLSEILLGMNCLYGAAARDLSLPKPAILVPVAVIRSVKQTVLDRAAFFQMLPVLLTAQAAQKIQHAAVLQQLSQDVQAQFKSAVPQQLLKHYAGAFPSPIGKASDAFPVDEKLYRLLRVQNKLLRGPELLFRIRVETMGPSKTFAEQDTIYVRQGCKILRVRTNRMEQLAPITVEQLYDGQINALFRDKYYEQIGTAGELLEVDLKTQKARRIQIPPLQNVLPKQAPFQYLGQKIYFITPFQTKLFSIDLAAPQIACQEECDFVEATRLFVHSRKELGAQVQKGVVIFNTQTKIITRPNTTPRPSVIRLGRLETGSQEMDKAFEALDFGYCRGTVVSQVLFATTFDGYLVGLNLRPASKAPQQTIEALFQQDDANEPPRQQPGRLTSFLTSLVRSEPPKQVEGETKAAQPHSQQQQLELYRAGNQALQKKLNEFQQLVFEKDAEIAVLRLKMGQESREELAEQAAALVDAKRTIQEQSRLIDILKAENQGLKAACEERPASKAPGDEKDVFEAQMERIKRLKEMQLAEE